MTHPEFLINRYMFFVTRFLRNEKNFQFFSFLKNLVVGRFEMNI